MRGACPLACALTSVRVKPGSEGKGMSVVEVENEKMLASAAAATDGTVMLASTVANALGEAMIKQTNAALVSNG